MKSLNLPFVKDGFTHTLIERNGPIALIARAKNRVNRHFEVIIIRTVPASTFMLAGKEISAPEREVYPSNEHWGTYGWTFLASDLARARAKFNALSSPNQ